MRRRWGSLPDLDVRYKQGKNSKHYVDISTHSNLSTSSKSSMKIRTLDESLSVSYSEAKRSSCKSAPTIEESDIDFQVSFQNVDIREYDVTVGDNPSCTFGVPISIGWKFNAQRSVSLDEYETVRPSGERRTQKQMLLPSKERESILREAGIARSSMAKAIRESNRTKSKRAQTVNNMGSTHRFEQGIESGMRKFKRAIFRRKKDSEEWAEWKKEFERKVEEEQSRYISEAVPIVNKVGQNVLNQSKRIVIEEDDLIIPGNAGGTKVPIMVEIHECTNNTASTTDKYKLQTSLSMDDFEESDTNDETSEELKEMPLTSGDGKLQILADESQDAFATNAEKSEAANVLSQSDNGKLQITLSGDELEDTNTKNAEKTSDEKVISATCEENNQSNPNSHCCTNLSPASSKSSKESNTIELNLSKVSPEKLIKGDNAYPVTTPSKDNPIEIHGVISEKINCESTLSTVDSLSDEKKDDVNNSPSLQRTDVEKYKSTDDCKTQ